MVFFFRSFPIRNVMRNFMTSSTSMTHLNRLMGQTSLVPVAVNRLSMGIHTGGSGVSLVNKLTSCICQEDALADLEALLVNPPQPFLVIARGGNVVTMLTSSLRSPLLVRLFVKFTVPSQLKVDISQAELQIPFEVVALQPGAEVALIASCLTKNDGAFDINTIQFVPTDRLPAFDTADTDQIITQASSVSFAEALRQAYIGPELDQLSERLQDAIVEVLQVVGVTPELCRYMQYYAKAVKEPQEYRQWLRSFRQCVA